MNYFSGSLADLTAASSACPQVAFLRKDFITSPEEVEVSYRAGADALLLIARILDGKALHVLVDACLSYGLRPFVEVRSQDDLGKLVSFAADQRILYGVNARDLATFTIDPLVPAALRGLLPGQAVYESGIHTPGAAAYARALGYDGILVGESVAGNPSLAASLVSAFVAARPDGNGFDDNGRDGGEPDGFGPDGRGRFWQAIAARRATLRARHGPRRPLVKICGITCAEDGLAAAASGADLLGFVFADSPRAASEASVRQTLDALEEAARHADNGGTRLPPLLVGVVTELKSPQARTAIKLASIGLLDAIQYHAPAGPETLAELDQVLAGSQAGRYLVVNAGTVDDLAALDALVRDGEPRVLIDARVQGTAGGTGQAVPSAVLESVADRGGLWLAGGLGPGTVGSIMDRHRVELVDASSLLEAAKGRKDVAKLEAFFKEIDDHAAFPVRRSVKGFFGPYGGRYVPEVLLGAIEEIEEAFLNYAGDPGFKAELDGIRADFIGRPTPLIHASNASHLLGGAQLYIKMEGLAHTGAHKINNAVGQALLARRMGKRRIIAETGAGQHGVAVAAACAKLGLECVVYMGAVDVDRQQPNVATMQLYGATVVPVHSGSRTLKDAINEAFRDWAGSFADTYYLIGSALGPAPYPDMVRTFQSVVGRETEAQLATRGVEAEALVACVGGGSNAIGFFEPFLDKDRPRLIGVEAGGIGPGTGEHAARMSGTGARTGIVHGYKSRFLLDDDGQVARTQSISAGLDYPGIGPELAALASSGRVEFLRASDTQALDALAFLARTEGVIFALESAHAASAAMALAASLEPGNNVVVNMSGRGDKDLFITAPHFRPDEWKAFLQRELAAMAVGRELIHVN
jgi:tryptophan synthase beta chain